MPSPRLYLANTSSLLLLTMFVAAALTAVVLVPMVWAQDAATGAIRGTVVDLHDLRIAGASIAVVNIGTSRRYSATTDAEGRFTLELLPPGDYSARAIAQGMLPQITPQLHVDLGTATELEFRLSVAGAQENVTVSAAPALVETQPSAVSTILDERAINELPLNGRRFSDLALLSPEVTQDPRGLTSSTNGDLSFGGLRGYIIVSWSTEAISTMPSSRKPEAGTGHHINFQLKWCRSSASPLTLPARNWDEQVARSLTS
jgi:carboxypeptidase family protein